MLSPLNSSRRHEVYAKPTRTAEVAYAEDPAVAKKTRSSNANGRLLASPDLAVWRAWNRLTPIDDEVLVGPLI